MFDVLKSDEINRLRDDDLGSVASVARYLADLVEGDAGKYRDRGHTSVGMTFVFDLEHGGWKVYLHAESPDDRPGDAGG